VSAILSRDTLIATGLSALLLTACGPSSRGPSADAVPTATTPVIRTDIAARQQLPGTLGFAGTYSIVDQTPGIFTELPAPGSTVSRGQVLYRVNGQPIPLFYGSAEWRSLSVGVPDGSDVNSLQANLVALGFGVAGLRVDHHFDWLTAAAVRRWQVSLGLAQTGAVALGDLVYAPEAIRVATVHASPGIPSAPGQIVLDATSPRHAVLMQLDVNLQTQLHIGTQVLVTLPDGSQAQGNIATIGTVAVAQDTGGGGPQNGPPTATVPVTITLANSAAGGNLDQAPVLVDVTFDVHRSVLAVPVTALLAVPGGTYGVDVVVSGQRHTVHVVTGLFDDRGLVEVSSASLHEGMLVEVPQS